MINQWISGVLGLIIAVVPFLSLSQVALTWTLVIIGLAVAVINFWEMIVSPKEHYTHSVESRV